MTQTTDTARIKGLEVMRRFVKPRGIVLALLLVALYWRAVSEMRTVWLLVDSYYTHGFLVPFVSLFFLWQKRAVLAAIPPRPWSGGYVWIAGACLLLLVGDFLGFRVFSQLSLLPMLAGISLVLQGRARTRALWFPLAYLIFMIPIPPSLTQSIALRLKLLATECAVTLANWCTIPLVRSGSTVFWSTEAGSDHLLVGDVCGGLRSLIALLAFGAIMAYISKTRPGARWVMFVLSGPIAVVANVFRVFLLCLVGYFFDSKTAAGTFHTVSGYLIFVVAFILFFALERQLRRIAPAAPTPPAPAVPPRFEKGGAPLKNYIAVGILLVATGGTHFAILNKQAQGGLAQPVESLNEIPSRIADYVQVGADEEIDERTAAVLETSTILIRNYVSPSGRPVQLIIVYAGSTRRSLHFPEICLTGGGWELREQFMTRVGILFTVKRLVLVRGLDQQAVLYWFKTGDHLTGNYFLNAAHWARSQLTFGSPTSAMIQVKTPLEPGQEEEAFAVLEDFATKLYPVLMRHVP